VIVGVGVAMVVLLGDWGNRRWSYVVIVVHMITIIIVAVLII